MANQFGGLLPASAVIPLPVLTPSKESAAFDQEIPCFRSGLNGGFLCPECESPMLLRRIDPERPSFELQTFECVKCNHVERVTTETKAARWRSGDLRAPT